MKLTIVISLLFLHLHLSSHCQVINLKKDSIQVTTITRDFFQWYIYSIHNSNTREYSPEFVKSSTGMTKLDFSTYFKNLKKYGFSDSLIHNELVFYEPCNNNLVKLKFSEFKKRKSLDEFQNLNCDFNNRRRWTGGQEMPNKYYSINVVFSKNTVLVKGFLQYGDSKTEGKENIVTLKYSNHTWKIISIN